MLVLVIFSAPSPMLVRIVLLAAVVPSGTMPNVSEFCERLTSPDDPVPVSVRVCGVPTASSATSRLAVSVPTIAGVNVTAKPQFAPGASGEFDKQLFVCEKSALFGPAIVIPLALTFRFASPSFASTTLIGGETLPVGTAPNLTTGGVNAAHATGLELAATFVSTASASAVVAVQLVHV